MPNTEPDKKCESCERLRAALERAEKLFIAIAMHDQNGHALDGANEVRAALNA